MPSYGGRAVTRSLSTQRTRVPLQVRALGRDKILKSADSGQNKRLSIHVESHFQDSYIKCNIIIIVVITFDGV